MTLGDDRREPREGAPTMGQFFVFRCDACAYEVQVSGGPDRGFEVATETISCATCEELFDVVVEEFLADPSPKRSRCAARAPGRRPTR